MNENNNKDCTQDDLLKIAIQEVRENVEKASPLEINFLNAVKPYLDKKSQKQIEKITNALHDVRVYEHISEGGIMKNALLHEDEDSVYAQSTFKEKTNNERITLYELLMVIASSLK